MKLVWVIFLFSASVTTIDCWSKNMRVAKRKEITVWNSQAQCIADDVELQEDENHLQKRDFGLITTIVGLGVGVGGLLLNILGRIGSHSPKIAIGIVNETPYKWKGLNVHFRHATSDNVIPRTVSPKETIAYGAYSQRLNVRGPAGVMAFYIPNDNVTLYVLFSVPNLKITFKNSWRVKIVQEKKCANEKIYDEIYKNVDPMKANHAYQKKTLDFGYNANGVMSTGKDCTLELHIKKKLTPVAVVSADRVKKAITTVLENIGDFSRKISIGIINETPYQWKPLNVYFHDGTSDVGIPNHDVPTGKGFNYPAREKGSATGISGVIALYTEVDHHPKTLYIFFGVSGSETNAETNWNLEILSEKLNANEELYKALKSNLVKGDGKEVEREVEGYTVKVTMSSSWKCTLELHVLRKNPFISNDITK